MTENYAYDDADKLLAVSINSAVVKEFTYDAAGRTTAIETGAGTTAFAYDYDGRATAITYPNATSDSHTYNALGARVGSSGANGSKTFRRAGIGVTSSVLDDGSRKYTPGVSSRSGSTSTFQHSGLKNATEQSNSSQSVTAERQYDAFGNVTNSSGTWQGPFGYASISQHETEIGGLVFTGAKYYDPSIGRSLTRNPARSAPYSFRQVHSSGDEGLIILAETELELALMANEVAWQNLVMVLEVQSLMQLVRFMMMEAAILFVPLAAVIVFTHINHGKDEPPIEIVYRFGSGPESESDLEWDTTRGSGKLPGRGSPSTRFVSRSATVQDLLEAGFPARPSNPRKPMDHWDIYFGEVTPEKVKAWNEVWRKRPLRMPRPPAPGMK